MSATGAVGGWFEPGDDVERAWDEAEAVLLACNDLDAVMGTIRDAESPVEARRALKFGFGFTGRQAALLLTLPVLSFTRSERERMHESRRARMELLADVTGAIPVVRAPVASDHRPVVSDHRPAVVEPVATGSPTSEPPAAEQAEQAGSVATESVAPAMSGWTAWEDEFDGTLDRIRSVMDEHYGVAPAVVPDPPPVAVDVARSGGVAGETAAADFADFADSHAAVAGEVVPGRRAGRRSSSGRPEEATAVLDEQIGELCEAIAALLEVDVAASSRLDDPRDSLSPSGQLLDSCGLDDSTGVRTLLWHLRRTGLESVEALLPFAEPLTGSRGFEVQSVRFEDAMSSGGLGPEPVGGSTWTGRLWPIAERRGFGYAVHYRPGPGVGAVWAYGGGEPLHLLWDSVVDMLGELYRALTVGEPCDAALAAVVDGRVVWTNLS